LGAVTTACALLASAVPAGAADGTYDVHACKGPTGAPAGVAGWTPASDAGGQATDACAGGGAFGLSLAPNAAAGQGPRWTFAAPAGTRVAGLGLTRLTQGFAGTRNTGASYAADATGGATGGGLTSLEACSSAADGCQTDLSAPVTKPGLDASGVALSLGCGRIGAGVRCDNPATSLSVAQAVVTLRDAAAPAVTSVQQVDAGETSGVLRTRFDAADAGGGLYRVRTLVDGQPFAVEGLGDPTTCADADPATPATHQFLTPAPCAPSVVGREVAVDHRKLTPGPHTVQTEVEDAAGNTTTVNAVPFPKANLDDTSPAGYERLRTAKFRAWFVQGRKHPRTLSINVGKRSTIRGEVVDAKGKGIAGVRLDVYHVVGSGKRTLAKTGLKTRGNGRFTYIVQSRIDTRRIQLTYRVVRPGPISNRRTLSLKVTKKGKPFYLPGNRPKKKAS
jgi:hypothetical protein